MEIESIGENKELIAFSDDTIVESYSNVMKYVTQNGRDFKLEELVTTVDKTLLPALSSMLDERVEKEVTQETSDIQLDEINTQIHQNIEKWKPELKEILNVVVIQKILEDYQYTGERITKELIKSNYLGNYSEDLSFIWLTTFREKLRLEK